MDISDLKKGEIYIAWNTVTGKGYVGQARKYVTRNNQKWGHSARWTRHLWEATQEKRNGYHSLINQAIRNHTKDYWKIEKLCDCLIEEMDELEERYIKELNTMDPNGYNMTSGGTSGSHSTTANEKKLVRNTNFSEQARKNMSEGQTNKKYEKKTRKHEEDKDLPKYLTAYRANGKIVAYCVNFQMGINTKERINKTFSVITTVEEALKDAIKYLDDLNAEYNERFEEYQKELQMKKDEERRKKHSKEVLPDFVYPIVEDGITIGYSVFGLKDYRDKAIPRREFKGHTNAINLEHAVKFIRLINEKNEHEEIPKDWLTTPLPENVKSADLPTYVRPTTYKGVQTGYRVDYFIKYENGKPLIESKCFSSKKLSMEEKLEKAKAFVDEMKEKYKTDNNKNSS
jgi:hypothetical protein